MCFNQKYSATFAVLGAASAAFFLFRQHKGKPLGHNLLIVPLIFYTIMEILQTIQYSFVNNCDTTNRILTEFSYLLVVVQPIMWNIIFLLKKRSVPLNGVARGILICAIVLCGVWIVGHGLRRLPFYGRQPDRHDEITEGPKTCTYQNEGEHLYWNYNLFTFPGGDANWFMYVALWFIPGLLIPGERSTIAMLAAGLLGSWMYVKYKGQTSHIIPSLWCLTSAPTLAMNVLYSLLG